MKDKKIVPFRIKPMPIKEKSQEEIIEARRQKRKILIEKHMKKK